MAAAVTLHIYDVTTEGAVSVINKGLKVMGTGAFHAAVEVQGSEWSYGYIDTGTGVFDCPPKKCEMHKYRESLPMGETKLSAQEIRALLEKLCIEWPGKEYDLLKKNCCTFSNTLCVDLGVGPIPSWVTNLAGAGAKGKDLLEAGGGAVASLASDVDKKLNVSGNAAAGVAAASAGASKLDAKFDISGKAATGVAAASARASEVDAKFDISGKAAIGASAAASAATAAATAATAKGAGMLGKLMGGSSKKG